MTLLNNNLAEETFTPTSYVAYSPAASVTVSWLFIYASLRFLYPASMVEVEDGV